MRILIVDDDKWYAESLASSLELGSFEIRIVTDAEEAIHAIDEYRPDATLLDFCLGARNALVLLNELQSYSDTRDISVIIISSDTSILCQDDVAQYGIKAIFNKSVVTPKEISECLRA